MKAVTTALLESYEKISDRAGSELREELLSGIISRIEGKGLSLDEEILKALDVVRTYTYEAYALRSFAADVISSYAHGGSSVNEIAGQALDIAKEIYQETHRAVTLDEIDPRLARNPAFARSEVLLKKSEEMAEKFSRAAASQQDFSSIKRGMESKSESEILSFLSALAERIEDPRKKRRVKAQLGMEVSKLSYLIENILGDDGLCPEVAGESADMIDTERTWTMRGLSTALGIAGRTLGEKQFIVDSLDTAETIDDSFIRSWAFRDIGKLMGGSSVARYAFERSIEGSKEIQSTTLQVITLTSMVEDYLSLVSESQARPFMDHLQSIVNTIENEEEKALSLTNTISAIGKIGTQEDNLTIDRTLLLTGSNRNVEEKIQLLSNISDSLIETVGEGGEKTREVLHAAIKNISEIRYPGVKPDYAARPGEMDAFPEANAETDVSEKGALTGIINVGLKGVHREIKNMVVRLHTLRYVDRNHISFLLKEALESAGKKVEDGTTPPDFDAGRNRKVTLWLAGYGITERDIRNENALPLMYPLHDSLRTVEARVAQLQMHETLFMKKYVTVKRSISTLQGHITDYEKVIGENPRIYKLETKFLSLLRKEELSLKRILSSLEKDMADHWKSARKLLLEYRKKPEINIRARMEEALDAMGRGHGHSIEMIKKHSSKLTNLNDMIEKIDVEIVRALEEFDASRARDPPDDSKRETAAAGTSGIPGAHAGTINDVVGQVGKNFDDLPGPGKGAASGRKLRTL